MTTHPKKPAGGIKGISERILKNAMVYLVDNDEDEFSDKHKISLFDDSKFEEAGNTTLDEINKRGKHHKEEDSLDQSNLLIKQKLNIPSGSSSEHGDDEELHNKLPSANHGKPNQKRRAQPPEERALLETHFN